MHITRTIGIRHFDHVDPVGETILINRGSPEDLISDKDESSSDEWQVEVSQMDGITRVRFRYRQDRSEPSSCFIRFEWPVWDPEAYLLMPAAVYRGNRFRFLPKTYPPFLHQEDGIGPDMPVTITDVPRLNAAGRSLIHLRSGDLSNPCVGIHFPGSGEGFLLLADAQTPLGYTGFRFEEDLDRLRASLTLEAPAVRQTRYGMCKTGVPVDDEGAVFVQGEELELRFRLYQFPCPDVPALFRTYCNIWQDLCGKPSFQHEVPLSHAFRLIEDKFNERQWNDQFGYYMTSPDGAGTRFGDWQAGWCGGGMHTLSFLADGQPLSKERARKTMDAVFGRLQHPRGWIYPVFSNGKPLGDDYCHMAENSGVMLMRKSADVLLFAGRHLVWCRERGETVPPAWLSGYEKLADAFVRVWRLHGQFGQL